MHNNYKINKYIKKILQNQKNDPIYKNKLSYYVNQTGGEKDYSISTIGFEFQTSDLVLLLFWYDNEKELYMCKFADTNSVFHDKKIKINEDNETKYYVKLDDFPMEQSNENLQWRQMQYFELYYDDSVIVPSNNNFPYDTEFETFSSSIEKIYQFEQRKDRLINYYELIKTHCEMELAKIFHFYLNTQFFVDKFDIDYFQTGNNMLKYIMYLPKNLSKDGQTHVGYLLYGFDNPYNPNELMTINVVPQVTITCDLVELYSIIMDLISNTPLHEIIIEIFNIETNNIEKYYGMFDDLGHEYKLTNKLRGYFLLFEYYYYVMTTHKTKQKLGIASRNLFSEMYNSLLLDLTDDVKLVLESNIKLLDFEYKLNQINIFQQNDEVTKFPYIDNKIIIEYRLLGYMISQNKNENYIPIRKY